MKPFRLLVVVLATGLAAASLPVAVYLTGFVLHDGLEDTCRYRAAAPLGTLLDGDTRVVEARSILPFGIFCAYQLRDGSERTSYLDVATAPTTIFIAAALTGAAALVIRRTSRKDNRNVPHS